MRIALAVRSRGNFTGRSGGAVIVRDRRILRTVTLRAPGRVPAGRGLRCVDLRAAEQNALLATARFGVAIEGYTIYTTLQP